MSPEQALQDRIAVLEKEVAGYQRIAKEASETEHKTVVLANIEGQEIRIYGPTPDREKAFGETVVEYLKLLQVTQQSIAIQGARKSLSAISSKLAEIEKALVIQEEQVSQKEKVE